MAAQCPEQDADKPFKLRTALEVQKDLAAVSTLQSELVWDVLGPDQYYILEKKLEYLYPDSKTVYTDKTDLRRAKKIKAKQKELRSKLFNNIWKQRKYTNDVLLCSIIYILVTDELDAERAKSSHNYTIHPIFRTRRCLNSTSSSGCCMIFIDDQSRIYQNWNDFVNNNEYPIGTIVAPAKGCYTMKNNEEVELECRLTPAYHNQGKAVINRAVSAISFVATAGSVYHPLFAFLSVGTKAYETIRDYRYMSDNNQRGTSSTASTYCSLGGNVISLTSSIVTLGTQMSVVKGSSLSKNANLSIQAINGAAMIVNCTKMIYSTYDIFTRYFLDGESLDFNDIVGFGSALLLFTHSLNNMSIISHLSKDSGNDLRCLLKDTVKGGLSLIAGNAVRLGVEPGDLLRLANDIPVRGVLSNIFSMCTNITKSGVLTTTAGLGALAMEIAPGLVVEIMNQEIVQVNFLKLEQYFGLNFVKHISNCTSLLDILNVMGQYLPEMVVQFILSVTSDFINTVADSIDGQQNTFLTTEMILFKMCSFAAKNCNEFTRDYLDTKRDDFKQGVAQYFQSFNPKLSDTVKDAKRSCDVCGGYYYLTA